MAKEQKQSSSKAGTKRARPVEPEIDWTLSGTRCIGLETVDGEPLPVFAKLMDASGANSKDVLIAAGQDAPLLAAIESLDECHVSYSSRKDGKEHDGMQWCIVSFATAKAAKKFLRTAPPAPEAGDDEDDDGPRTGLQAWLSNHTSSSRMDPRSLQAWADRYMTQFDELEAGHEQAKTELEAKMEADGFTLITKKGAKGHAAIPSAAVGAGTSAGSVAASAAVAAATSAALGHGASSSPGGKQLSDNQKRKLKRGSLVHEDFYRFQAMGAKLDQLADLRAKFSEDRERIARLKEGRVFKPF